MDELNKIFEIIKIDISYAQDLIKRHNKKEEAVDFLKASHRHVAYLLFSSAIKYPEINVATTRQKKRYKVHKTFTATSYDVALNKIYGIELKEGQEYSTSFSPYGVIKVDNKVYPVYFDDAGQCDYIILSGKEFSSGSYSLMPEREFVYYIINDYYNRAIRDLGE